MSEGTVADGVHPNLVTYPSITIGESRMDTLGQKNMQACLDNFGTLPQPPTPGGIEEGKGCPRLRGSPGHLPRWCRRPPP